MLIFSSSVPVPVCPHGGGVGLCEYIQHMSLFDYIAVSGSLENRYGQMIGLRVWVYRLQ